MSGSTISIDFMNFNFTCTMEACFSVFDKNCDGFLDFDEFHELCKALFKDENGKSYELTEEFLLETFKLFDVNNDNKIDKEEFTFCWNNWIKIIVKPISALLIVDVQNDFLLGTLDIRHCPAKHNGEDIIEPINNLLNSVDFEVVYYSYDWHPNDHVSFIDNIHLRKLHETSPIPKDKAKVYDTVIFDMNLPMEQKLWPRHCVQNTWGAGLHKSLKVIDNGIKIYKGTNPDIDSYSLFWDNMKLTDTKLDAQLKSKNITDVYVCGVAYDVCVGSTAKDALTCGYRTILLDDCCRGVDLLDIEKLKKYTKENFGIIVDSKNVKAMIEGNDRRPELGNKLIIELKKSMKNRTVSVNK